MISIVQFIPCRVWGRCVQACALVQRHRVSFGDNTITVAVQSSGAWVECTTIKVRNPLGQPSACVWLAQNVGLPANWAQSAYSVCWGHCHNRFAGMDALSLKVKLLPHGILSFCLQFSLPCRHHGSTSHCRRFSLVSLPPPPLPPLPGLESSPPHYIALGETQR